MYYILTRRSVLLQNHTVLIITVDNVLLHLVGLKSLHFLVDLMLHVGHLEQQKTWVQFAIQDTGEAVVQLLGGPCYDPGGD